MTLGERPWSPRPLPQDKARAQLTVEHVLPQKLDAGGAWAARFTAPQHAGWVQRLANLALLSGRRNSAAGQAAFAQKKERYRGTAGTQGYTNIPLTDAILSQGGRALAVGAPLHAC